MQKKKNFKEIKFGDLSGGINTLNYPTEIENKQFVSLENWNFKGNNLVSEKGVEDTGLPTVLEVGGFKIDNNKVYQTKGTDLYVDGVVVDNVYGARIKVSGLSNTFYKQIKDENGEIITNQLSSTEYFPDGVFYYIVVDGTKYKVTGDSKTKIYENLSEELTTAGYTASIASESLYISSSSPIVVTIPNYKTFVIYLQNIIDASNYRWANEWVKGFAYSINGLKDEFIWTTDKTGDFSSVFEFDKSIRDRLYDSIVGLGLDIDVSKSYLSPGFTEDGEGTIWGAEYESGYSAVIVSGADSIEMFKRPRNSIGGSSGNDVFVMKSFPSIDPTDTFTLNQGTPDELVVNFSTEGIASTTDMYDWLVANGYPNTLSIYGKWTGDGTSPSSYTGLIPLTAYNVSAGTLNTNGIASSNISISEWYGLTESNFNINTNTFENDLLSASFPQLGRTNITVGNLGELIIDKDSGGAYYRTDNVLYSPSEDEVGLPTVGTIYQGKIILGGFEGNDNIVFSQTSTPNQPLNVLNFSSYSAGGQSISGGDKGVITGMSVGENGLYVFKDNSIWYSNSDFDTGQTYNYKFNKVTSSGALTQNVITEVQQDTFYLDWKTRNVRRLSYEQNLTTLRDTSISDEVDKAFNDLPEDQPLATSSFSYPNYTLSLTDGTAGTITYPNGKTYNLNNKHFIYNVENKSWTTRTGLINVVLSEGDYLYRDDGKVYKAFSGDVPLADGDGQHKANTFGNDWDFKKLGRQSVAGKISAPIGETKTFELGIVVDGVEESVITVEATGEEKHFEERIPLYEKGKQLSVNVRHSGTGSVEVAGLSYYISIDKSATYK